MTVSSTNNSITYSGNGSNTTFPFSFAMPNVPVAIAAGLLTVTYVSPTGVQSTVQYGPGTTQYQLTLTPPVSPNPTGVGGAINYNPSGTPIPFGSTLSIVRTLPVQQTTSLQNQGTLWQNAIESALDYLAMLSQQIGAIATNIVQAPPTDPGGLNYVLPSVAARASKALIFDSAGNVAAGAVPSGNPTSSAMAPVTSAASLAAGRAALGLGSAAVENIGGGLADDGAGNLRVLFSILKRNTALTISAANYLNKIKVTPPLAITLPAASSLWAGFGFWVENVGPPGALTITPGASDQFEISGITYPTGQSATFGLTNLFIYTDGAALGTWYVEVNQGLKSNLYPGSFQNLSIFAPGGSLTLNTNTTTPGSVGAIDASGNSFTIPILGLTCNLAASGLNGLDTGTVAGNTFYYIWAIINPTAGSVGLLASLQPTANATFLSHLPVGFTAYGRIGVVKTNSGATGFLQSVQYGRRVQLQTPVVLGFGAAGTYNNISPTWAALSLATAAPQTASRIMIIVGNNANNVGAGNIVVAPNNTGYSGPAGGNPAPISLVSTTQPVSVQAEFALESANIYWATSSGTVGTFVTLMGWEDNL